MSLIRCSKSRVMVIFSIIFILQNNHYFYSVFTSPTPLRHPELKKSVLKSGFKQSGNESCLASHVFEKSGDFTGSEGSSPVTRTKIKNPLMKIGGFLILYYSFFIIQYSSFIKTDFRNEYWMMKSLRWWIMNNFKI